ncbi:LysE/ArgO family amino acid transporter [Oleisolibacter albus]|uniref:LysE/ArgO family amino acid transporter n=1 Tax=Oleisolibacter albus TaxID=2171757 RepID=UPI001EFD2063|nr:LysE family transporter [Oleisolibacter albus]
MLVGFRYSGAARRWQSASPVRTESLFLLEDLGILWRGLVLGVVIAAPVGPIGLLCIRRTLERGLSTGLATGVGAAMADALFSAIAAFGVTAVIDLLTGHVRELRLIGGVFLLAVAVHSFLREPKPLAKEPVAGNLFAAAVTGLGLTFTNPVTILGIFAVIAGFGATPSPGAAGTLVAGIFLGSLCWWTVLSGGITLIRHRVTVRTVHWINVGTGVLLAALGLWALAGVLLV